LAPITMVLYLSNYINKLRSTFLYLLAVISTITSLLWPPMAYRSEPEEGLLTLRKIVLEEKVNVYSDFEYTKFVSEHINYYSLDQLYTNKNSNYVLLNTSSKMPDVSKANIRRYEDRDFKQFYIEQENLIKSRLQNHEKLIGRLQEVGFITLVRKPEYVILQGDYDRSAVIFDGIDIDSFK